MTPRDPQRDPSRTHARLTQTTETSVTQAVTQGHAEEQVTAPLKEKGARDPQKRVEERPHCRGGGVPIGTDSAPPQSAPRWEENRSREAADGRQVWSHKKCARCQLVLPAAAFIRNGLMRSGLHSWCRGCVKERNRIWRAANPEYVANVNDDRREGPFPKECAGCGVRFAAVRRAQVRCAECQVEHRRRAASARKS